MTLQGERFDRVVSIKRSRSRSNQLFNKKLGELIMIKKAICLIAVAGYTLLTASYGFAADGTITIKFGQDSSNCMKTGVKLQANGNGCIEGTRNLTVSTTSTRTYNVNSEYKVITTKVTTTTGDCSYQAWQVGHKNKTLKRLGTLKNLTKKNIVVTCSNGSKKDCLLKVD